MKPQDLAVALKLVALKKQHLSYHALAQALYLSPFEAHAAVQRLIAARLAVEFDRGAQPVMAALRHFVLQGAPYCYPPVRSETTIGFLTASAVPPLRKRMAASHDLPYVWPHPKGNARGMGLLPLYENLPLAAVEDQEFYSILALFDALRVGQAREREMAASYLKECLT